MENYPLGLIGYPLEHSLSPRLHHAALKAMELDGQYRLFVIPPFPQGMYELAQLLDKVRNSELQGLNVTIPHKQNVIPYLDKLSPAAHIIGAVNTIYLEDGSLCGDNTDSVGFLADLQPLLGRRYEFADSATALILGAGGSARAVAFALISHGWSVYVAARRLEQAQGLVNDYLSSTQNAQIKAISFDAGVLDGISEHTHLIINATPVGMWPHVNENPWPRGMPITSTVDVYDLVYNPAETLLLREAKAAGARTRNGIGMLIEQAALALERWTQKPVPRQPMWGAVPEFVLGDPGLLPKEEYDPNR